MKFVVIRIKGRQYRVSEGDVFLVDKISKDDLNPEVLLIADGSNVEVGQPVIKNAKVNLEIVSELEKGQKVNVFKYKAKSRYRKRIGFRPKYTKVLFKSISS